jgi:hypothetical protein
MPYIKQTQRTVLEDEIQELVNRITTAIPEDQYDGVLNYVITEIVHRLILTPGVRYARIQQIVGVLECAKLEVYRKVAGPYEDVKIEENGDVGIFADDS